ncbi:MAG TPA: LuxR C-terminal-related transcriptional regulator [Baekduia sp.]|uniref:helix-turn-helix transcriptional regulator n=1 Tax=Baekduia sp. TaxID=2600305 RepID=UPI002C3DBC50|nr:LuxR C-terminal-related transcriptional regulator [Baekduia sp.]HMJ36601.1 LuxR C-terminal-related transcriptional regulator [Baekduia sp.]
MSARLAHATQMPQPHLRVAEAAPDAGPGWPEADFRALAELVSARGFEVAERAQAALAPVLPHDALVLVTPGSPDLPVQIAAPPELLERVVGFDWSAMVGSDLPEGCGATRLVLPDLGGGVRLAGWVAGAGKQAVALILGASGPLQVNPEQERAAMRVAILTAARARSVDQDPSPGTLAFSLAINQERKRVRSEMHSRQAATLSSLLQTLRRAGGPSGSRSVPPEVLEAIDLASGELLELKAGSRREEASTEVAVAQTFADAEDEVRGIVRSGELQLVVGLDAAEDARLPRAIAHAARIVTRASALNTTHHPGAGKVRVQWRLTGDALTVVVADDGDGFPAHHDRPRRELAYMRRRVAGLRATVEVDTTPQWGTAVVCELPLHGPPLAPETPAAELISHLRAREREVLELLVAGLRNGDIAERLFITVRTVKFHVSNILHKLDVQSRTEAIALAHAAGISGPDES